MKGRNTTEMELGGSKGRGCLHVVLLCIAFVCVDKVEAVEDKCPHPSVPFAARYVNVTGGLDQVK